MLLFIIYAVNEASKLKCQNSKVSSILHVSAPSEPTAKRSRQPTGGEQEVLLPVAQITFKEAVARHGRGDPVSDAEKKAAIKSFWLDNPATMTCIPPWSGAVPVSRRLPRPGPAA